MRDTAGVAVISGWFALAIGVALTSFFPAFAQTGVVARTAQPLRPAIAAPDAIDRYITGEMQTQRIPGLSLAIIKNGEIVKMKGYGRANVELGVPVTPDTVFQTGSVAKQFTAALVMLLVEQGTIDLDAPVGKYLGDVPEIWKPITVRQLLTHTSGIATFPYGGAFDLRRDYTEDELLEFAKKMPLDFAPGTQFRYSNTGYVLLGILIHKVTGTFYGDLLQVKIFKPLGMTRSRVVTEADIVLGRAAGYQHVNGKLRNQDWVAPLTNTTADGSLYTTVRDMVRWDQALSGPRLLKTESLRRMWTPATLANGKPTDYGFGWVIGEVNGRTLIEHAGQWQGFKTMIARYPDDKISVIVLTNLASCNAPRIAHRVAGLTSARLAVLEAPPLPDDAKVTPLLREALREAASGKITEDRYTPTMQKVLTPDALKQGVQLFAALGELKKLVLTKRDTSGDLRTFRYRGTFARETLTITLALDKDNKVAGLLLRPE